MRSPQERVGDTTTDNNNVTPSLLNDCHLDHAIMPYMRSGAVYAYMGISFLHSCRRRNRLHEPPNNELVGRHDVYGLYWSAESLNGGLARYMCDPQERVKQCIERASESSVSELTMIYPLNATPVEHLISGIQRTTIHSHWAERGGRDCIKACRF